MPHVRKTNDILAFTIADLHLDDNPPIARSAEPNWFVAMDRQLKQVRDLVNKYEVPLVIAGDIFNKWKVSSELVNFAIHAIPRGSYAIPGQHDLPHHSYSDITKSPYWTLVEAGTIKHLDPYIPVKVNDNLILIGYPFGHKTTGIYPQEDLDIPRLAVIHDYCWKDGHNFPGAPLDKKAVNHAKRLKGHDFAVFGDNHKGFLTKKRGILMLNSGTFLRRTTKEKDYTPFVGILRSTGLSRYELDTSQDAFIDIDDDIIVAEKILEMKDFVDKFHELKEKTFDFVEAVVQMLKTLGVSKRTNRIITEALEARNVR